MKKVINALDNISPCILSHYHKSGYSDILPFRDRCNNDIGVLCIWETPTQ